MNYLVVDFNSKKEKQLLFDVLKDLDGIHIIQINKYKKFLYFPINFNENLFLNNEIMLK